MSKKGLIVTHVTEGSALSGLVAVGDSLISVNGNDIIDQIDYQYYASDANISLHFICKNGEDLNIDLGRDDDPGIILEEIEIKQCSNKCIFCYVDQMPPGGRETLFLKDDDFRLSFLFGSYITLTNLSATEEKRIITQQLGPLYISVHATDDLVAEKLLGRKRPAILKQLERFSLNGIKMHLQLVIVPGINDGGVLEKTLTDLASLYPSVISIAAVMVGLTRFHNPEISIPTQKEAASIMKIINLFQKKFLKSFETRLIFPSDDLLIRSALPMADIAQYEELHQIENGVGMVAEFQDEFEWISEAFSGRGIKGEVVIVTADAFAPYMEKMIQSLDTFGMGAIKVLAVENEFLGSSVTVAGLLTGVDIISRLSQDDCLGFEKIILPSIIFNDNELTLDGMTLADMNARLANRVIVVEPKAESLLEIL